MARLGSGRVEQGDPIVSIIDIDDTPATLALRRPTRASVHIVVVVVVVHRHPRGAPRGLLGRARRRNPSRRFVAKPPPAVRGDSDLEHGRERAVERGVVVPRRFALAALLVVTLRKLDAELVRLLLALLERDPRTDALPVSPAHLAHELSTDPRRRWLDQRRQRCGCWLIRRTSSRLGTEKAEKRVVRRGRWGCVGRGGAERARCGELGKILDANLVSNGCISRITLRTSSSMRSSAS